VKTTLPKVPVVIVSTYGSAEIQAACFAQGAAAFLEKPFTAPQMFAAIEVGSPGRKAVVVAGKAEAGRCQSCGSEPATAGPGRKESSHEN